MKSRWWIAAEFAFLAVLWAGGFLIGRRYEHRVTQQQLDAYVYVMQEEGKRADAWQAKAKLNCPVRP